MDINGPASQGVAGGKVARDWKANPAIVQAPAASDLYCLGDVHGDYDRLVTLLNKSGLIKGTPKTPDQVQWTGGAGTLVCTGDIIDKWKNSIQSIQLLRTLQASAAAAGGRVIVTMGNHEGEFLANPTDKKSAPFQAELAQAGINPADVAAGKDRLGIGQWLRNLPVGAKVGDWFFVHAGNTGGRSLGKLESDIESGVGRDGFGSQVLLGKDSPLEAQLTDGGWWTSSTSASENLKALGVKHLVEGHQPGKVVLADGTVRKKDQLLRDGLPNGRDFWMIDCGLSRGADGAGEILHVKPGGKETAIAESGKTQKIGR